MSVTRELSITDFGEISSRADSWSVIPGLRVTRLRGVPADEDSRHFIGDDFWSAEELCSSCPVDLLFAHSAVSGCASGAVEF